MAYMVVADHVGTLSFAIADGAVPSNDGRGYVLRRVLRRAVRYGRQNLNAELGFFAKLVNTPVELMGDTFPELREKEEYVTSIVREREESISKTVDKGIVEFKKRCDALGPDNKVFSGVDAHFFYTSMGFPVDLTELMCEERGLSLYMHGYEAKTKEEEEICKQAHMKRMSAGSGKDMRLVAEQTSHLVNKGGDATDDSAKYVWNEDLDGCASKALSLDATKPKMALDSWTAYPGTMVLQASSLINPTIMESRVGRRLILARSKQVRVPSFRFPMYKFTGALCFTWERSPKAPFRLERLPRVWLTTFAVHPSPPTTP